MIVEIISENEIRVTISTPYEIKTNISPTIDLSGLYWTEPPRMVQVKLIDDYTTLNTNNGYLVFMIPENLNNYEFEKVSAYVSTPSNNDNIEIKIRNLTKNLDILSSNIIIEEGEYTSYTSSSQPIINEQNKIVNTGDLIAIITIETGTNAKGLGTFINFKKGG